MGKSKIEWTDLVWNPVTGCTKLSAGCKYCYAKETHDKRHKAYKEGKLQNLIQYSVPFETVMLHSERLMTPFAYEKPRRIFVNSMSDLFHEEVPFEFIDQVMAVMALTPHLTYQVLTKRADRMVKYFNEHFYGNTLTGAACEIFDLVGPAVWEVLKRRAGKRGLIAPTNLPLPNVHFGVSVENQETANERIPLLLKVPAAVRFLSCEPLLGPVDLTGLHISGKQLLEDPFLAGSDSDLHWVIVGGESGPHARPMHPDWARSLRDQCEAAGVPFFFKQWGEWLPAVEMPPDMGHPAELKRKKIWVNKHDRKDTGEGPGCLTIRVGKKAAGNLLDGKQHLEFPKQYQHV